MHRDKSTVQSDSVRTRLVVTRVLALINAFNVTKDTTGKAVLTSNVCNTGKPRGTWRQNTDLLAYGCKIVTTYLC